MSYYTEHTQAFRLVYATADTALTAALTHISGRKHLYTHSNIKMLLGRAGCEFCAWDDRISNIHHLQHHADPNEE